MSKLLKEIIVVGLATAVIGTLISYIAMGEEAKKFKHFRKLILIFFLTGAIIHTLAEVTGVNKWYCSNGHACVL